MRSPPEQPDRVNNLTVSDKYNFVDPIADNVEGQPGVDSRGVAVGEGARVICLDDAAFLPGEVDARRAFGLHAVYSGFGRERAEGRDHPANAATQPDGDEDRVGLFAPIL